MDNLGLRTGTPMGDWRSFNLDCPDSGGWVKGKLYAVEDIVGVSVDDYDYGDDAVIIYHADKVEVEKDVATADVFVAGDKVYFNTATGKVTPTAGALEWIGIAVEDAGAADTLVIIDLKGDKAT